MARKDNNGNLIYFKKEPILDSDDFGNPQYREDLESLAQTIQNLIIIEKGTYPNQPELGVGISQYMFEFLDDTTIFNVQSAIESQLEKFIEHPYIITQVNVTKLENMQRTRANTLGISVVIYNTNTETQAQIDYVMVGNTSNKRIVSKLYIS